MEAPKEDRLGSLGPLPLHVLRRPPPSRGRTSNPERSVTSFTLGGKLQGQSLGSSREFLPFSHSDQTRRAGAGPEGGLQVGKRRKARATGERVWKQGVFSESPRRHDVYQHMLKFPVEDDHAR